MHLQTLFSKKKRSQRTCRFCKKSEPDTTFEMKAHVLPELMGKNGVLAYDECDACNRLFSSFESHLAAYFRPYLTLVGVEGKKGVPSFHSRTINNDEKTRLKLEFDNTGQRHIQYGNRSDYKVDKENKMVSLTLRIPPHRPINIYKAFVKIGLSMIPEEKLEKYCNLFDWLLNKDPDCTYFCFMRRAVMPGKMFAGPSADLYEATEIIDDTTFIPELTLVVNFGNIIVQIFLPLSIGFDYQRAEGKEVHAYLNPNVEYYVIKENETPVGIKWNIVKTISLKSNESVSFDDIIHLTYASIEGDIYPD